MLKTQIVVLKYGSDSVTNNSGMDEAKVAHHAGQLAAMHRQNGLVVVSSGAVAEGRVALPLSEQGIDHDEQSLAMAGSAAAFLPWQIELRKHDIAAGHLLITHREINDQAQEGKVMLEALQKNLKKSWITVANENDALSVAELKKLAYGGDNDGLAMHIAEALQATKLLLLTNMPGLLDETGKLVTSVATPEDYERAQHLATLGPKSERPSGMLSKVEAAWQASGKGIDAYIGSAMADIPDVISGLGTYFPARR